MKSKDADFCDGCCYRRHCEHILEKCCYLVKNECKIKEMIENDE